ncbi:hypothetical protein TNCT_291231, partial [Trichonephila clavata]
NSYHEALPQDDVISSNSWLKSSKKSENMKTYLRKDREAARVQCMTKMKESSFLPKSPQLVSFTGWRDPTVSTPRTSSFRGSQASVDAKPEASRKERTVRETSIDSITEEERRMKESSFLPKSPQLVSFTGWRDPTVPTPRTSSFRGSQASVDARPKASRKERTVRETSIDGITEEERRMTDSCPIPKNPCLPPNLHYLYYELPFLRQFAPEKPEASTTPQAASSSSYIPREGSESGIEGMSEEERIRRRIVKRVYASDSVPRVADHSMVMYYPFGGGRHQEPQETDEPKMTDYSIFMPKPNETEKEFWHKFMLYIKEMRSVLETRIRQIPGIAATSIGPFTELSSHRRANTTVTIGEAMQLLVQNLYGTSPDSDRALVKFVDGMIQRPETVFEKYL